VDAFDVAMFQWREGERRLAGAPAAQRATLERVVGAIVAELRRRLGGPYTTRELADLYAAGTSWATDLAYRQAPEDEYAWDPSVVVDAAFARYLRGATDYAGGRRLGGD